MCGTAPWEWDETQGGSRHAYEAVPVRCEGCYRRAAAQNTDPGANTDGITVELHRGGTQEAAMRQVKANERYQRLRGGSG